MAHHQRKPSPFGTKKMVGWDEHFVQGQRAASERESAHVVEAPDAYSGPVALDEERAHPGMSCRAGRAGVDNNGLRERDEAYRGLLTRQAVAALRWGSDRAHRRGVRARVGLRESDGD